jgi:non-ribosomal peptide synthetase component E (peptide arylation enzyme)
MGGALDANRAPEANIPVRLPAGDLVGGESRMILRRIEAADAPSPTLDDLFRRAAVCNADAIALADPDDRDWFTDREARRFTYAQADRVVWAISARLRGLGLQTDSVIGVQLPNTTESVLTLLGIMRAGMIPAPLPMLWRDREIIAALSGVGAKALITASRIGATDHGALAGRVAMGLFSLRYVCAFGDNLADGLVPLDDVFTAAPDMQLPPQRDGNPADHVAIVTFEPTPRGILPIARNHHQLIAAGNAIVGTGMLRHEAALLSPTPCCSFAGLSVTLLPWLLTGGRLVLHQPFDAAQFQEQARAHECDAVVVPGPLAAAFDDAPQSVVALWHAPERLEPKPLRGPVLDVTAFGEFGIHAAPRGDDGHMVPLALGLNRQADDAIEARRSTKGTLLLSGPLVAQGGFDAATTDTPSDGFVDTGYPCRIDPEPGSLVVTAPQAGMIGIGGYRIARGDIDAFAAALPEDSPIAVLPDALLGQRLRGRTGDPAAAARAGQAVNPLLGGAFAA